MHYENLFAFMSAAIDCIKISTPPPVLRVVQLPCLKHMLLMPINPLPVYSISQTLFPIVYSLTCNPIKAELLTLLLLQSKINSQHVLMTHTTCINQLPVDKSPVTTCQQEASEIFIPVHPPLF